MTQIARSTEARGPDFGLYVHIPFCHTKCGYCDFYSVALKDRDTGPLVRSVQRELETRLGRGSFKIRTVFFGGGTPTILPAEQLESVLASVTDSVSPDDLVEFTVEANPATVDDEKTHTLVRGGVTRVSMGAQSFWPEELATLERLHSPEDIAPSVSTLRTGGVDQINLDLIFGIPGQTLATWTASLERAIALEPNHLACYGLTFEPQTPLTAQRNAGRIVPCDENLEADMYLATVEHLASHGYEQYETSSFARPGCRCQHNVLYWRNGPYIGVGPSAAGCFDGRRYKNVADVAGYVRSMQDAGHAEAQVETVTIPMLITEMVMMQLRLVEGLDRADFVRRCQIDPLVQFGDVLERLVAIDKVAVTDDFIKLTPSGRLVADAVIGELTSASPTVERLS